MTLEVWLAILLAIAVVLGWTRLLLWHFGAEPELRSHGWRIAVLLLLQPLCAAFLYLTLFPPALPGETRALTIATRNAPRLSATGPRIVALPEAGAIQGAEGAPDLATVLRREPGARQLRIIGDGLEARDRDAARGRAIAFEPRTAARGIARLDPPSRAAPGSAFAVGGAVSGVARGTVELLDPSGRRVDVATLPEDGAFRLQGTARLPGLALFTVRVRDGARLVEAAEVPVWTAAEPPLRLLLVAGAPGPELKYLRRWATDSGAQVQLRMNTGGGIELGDAPVPIIAMTLRRFDAAVLDERSWAALGAGERAALTGAVRDGLGLLLRVTGPVGDGVRGQWRALGIAVSAAQTTATMPLRAAALDEEALGARRGPGSVDRPAAINPVSDDPAVLTHRVAGGPPAGAAPLAPGLPPVIANWHALGRGRVGVWTLTDSFTLVLSGDADRHAELWSAALGALARPGAVAQPAVTEMAWQGERVALCRLGAPSEVLAPGGARTALLIDPASPGCAAYWPVAAGWHSLRQTGAGAQLRPFFVYPANALPEVRAAQTRDATLRLAQSPPESARGGAAGPARRGSSWPWFAAWLAASVALWWFERARVGRGLASRNRR